MAVDPRKAKDQEGFTLIELLIVIVILGILAAVVVFAVGGITGRSTTNACKTDWSTVNSAQEAYKADHGSYANSVADLIAPTASPTQAYIKTSPSQQAYKIDTTNAGAVNVYVPGTSTAIAGAAASNCP